VPSSCWACPAGGRHVFRLAWILPTLLSLLCDGKLSLQEFQAAHERIFKAMDADHDGTVTFEEMQAFIRGH
jgi:EF hand